MKNILLIGCGHMGNSLLIAWSKINLYSIYIVDPKVHLTSRALVKNRKIKIYKNITDINKNIKFKFIVLAVKPLDLKKVIKNLENYNFQKNSVLISVIAGKKIEVFQNNLQNIKQIVRVMPNMPASIGEGMSCIVKNKFTTTSNLKEINKLFKYTGKTIIFDNEKQIDMATAISGSGPGFVFNLVDAMEKSAIRLGFNKNIAHTLVTQTFYGSISLLIKKNISPEKLVKTVATKGGTTEAGLKVMKQKKVHEIFIKLVKSSYKKAKQQGEYE